MLDQEQAIKKDASLLPDKNQEIISEERKPVMPGKYGYGEMFADEIQIQPGVKQGRSIYTSKSSHLFGNISLHPKPVIKVHPKLGINAPGDEYEQEADAVADKIMRMTDNVLPVSNSSPVKIQRKCETCGKEEPEEEEEEYEPLADSMIQRKCTACEEEEKKKLHRKESAGNTSVSVDSVQKVIQSPGQQLDKSTRSFMESRFGFDFGKVQIHNDPIAHQSAKDINALAYTYRHHIAFGAGQYRPHTQSGRKLLAHELTHTLQQGGNNIRRQIKVENTQPSSAKFIVDDGATPAEGMMTKSVFMATLNEAVCIAVNEGLQGTAYSSDNCPYIRAIFARQANSTASQIEQIIIQYEPSAATATNAAEMIQMILARVRIAVNQWKQRQNLEDVSGDITGMMAAISLGPRGAGVTSADENPSLQFKANPGGANNIQSPRSVIQSLGKGHALDSNTRSQMESAFETSFGHVEVHTDSHAANIAGSMNAKAFAVGNHIAFASGAHKPGTLMGDALMAHELAHVVQQSNGEHSAAAYSQNHLESDANLSAFAAVSGIWQKGRKNSKKARPKARTGLSLHRCEDSLSSLFSSTTTEGPEDAGTDAPTDAGTETVPEVAPPFEQKDSTTGATLGDTEGHKVQAYYFKGTSDRKALIIGGVHGSEPGGVEVVYDLLGLLQSTGAPAPFFSVIIVPELFAGNVKKGRRKSGGQVSALKDDKAVKVDTPDPNRQFPAVGKDPVTNTVLNCVVDAQNRCVEPENLILLDLVNKFQPERVASVHGHSIPKEKKGGPSVKDQLKTGGGPSITTDPRPGNEKEDHALTLAMAKEANKKGVHVPGNFIGTADETTTYPSGTATHDPGISFGGWGSHATPTRPAMNIVLIETYGNTTSKNDADNAARKTELMNLAEILRDFFLVDPSKLPTP